MNSIPKHFRQTSWVFESLIPISKMLHLSNSILIRKTKIFLQDNTWRTVYIDQIKDFIAQDNFPVEKSGFFAILDGHGGAKVS